MPEIIHMLSEYVAELGVKAYKEHIKDKIDEHKLRNDLRKYIEHERKYHDFNSLAKEFDYQGLVEYIGDNLLSDVETRIYCVNKKEREIARKKIIDMAENYSKAKTSASQKTVAKLIANSIDIIRKFHKNTIPKTQYILAAEIVDAISEENERLVNKSNSHIDTKFAETNSLLETIKEQISTSSTNNSADIISIDSAIKVVKSEGFGPIENQYKTLFKHLSIDHPLSPDYGYIMQNGKVKSAPITENANKRFPAKIALYGTVRADNEVLSNFSINLFDYAYRHQRQLIMNVKEAKKYLGDRLDPIQDEASKFVGSTLQVIPPSFPPAFPCSIKVGKTSFFDYVLLRTQEILDDGTFIIGNNEQENYHFNFEIRLNPARTDKIMDFKIKMNNACSCDMLKFSLFMKALKEHNNIHVYVLSSGTDIIAGTINQINYKTGFDSIEEEIEFLERICAIEEYFDVDLNVIGDISESDYSLLIHISDMVMKDEVSSTWSEATFTGTVDDNFRKKITEMDDSPCAISFIANDSVELFNTKINIRFMRIYKCAIMTDIERIQKLAQLLHNSEDIKFTFRPGEDDTSIDTLKIPNEFE